MDGTGFRICEQTTFSTLLYLHKFNRVVVRYEVVMAIHSDDIAAIYGNFERETGLILYFLGSNNGNAVGRREGESQRRVLQRTSIN